MDNVIISIEKGSIAEELAITPGCALLAVNGQPVADVFDYRYLIQNEYVELLVKTPGGGETLFEIEKDEWEDLGLVFASGLMDKAKSCANKCVFCFIDQLPKGMRETLYFKDDDSRLSFLQGNYVTLTNVSGADLDRIIYYHLSPINISVHTTDPALRARMLKNPRAAGLAAKLDKLRDAGLAMNFQIVLCKGINDGVALDRTIGDLAAYMPAARSLSVVPVGLTGHRAGLFPLEPLDAADCARVIRQVSGWQKRLKAGAGTRFVYAADELYLKAGLKVPGYAAYEDFPQLENGVGMLALFGHELDKALKKPLPGERGARRRAVVTGSAAAAFMRGNADKIMSRYPDAELAVVEVANDFFGENVTVSGLLTGRDILKTLKAADPGEVVYVPENALRADDNVFLDDITIEDMERELGVPVVKIPCDGAAFVKAVLSDRRNQCQNQ